MTDVLSQDEIDQLLTAIHAGDADPEDWRPEADTRRIKIYDFRRPDRFKREHTRMVSMFFEVFTRLTSNILSTRCRCPVHVHVASVDELSFEEFIRSIPTPTSLGIINPDPLGINWVIEIDPAITFCILNALMGGEPDGTKCQHELTELEMGLMEGLFVRILGPLREAWSPIVDLRPRLGSIETNPVFVQVVGMRDMCLLVTLEVKASDTEGMMNVLIPYESVRTLFSEFDEGRVRRPERGVDGSVLGMTRVTSRAELFRRTHTVGEITGMGPGTVLFAHDDHPKFTGSLKIDGSIVGRFEMLGDEDPRREYKRVRILERLDVSEEDHMEEKNNVTFTTGSLDGVRVKVICELGRRELTLRQTREMGEGTILELDKLAGEPVDVFINNVLAAKGEVVVIEEKFGVRILEVLTSSGDE